MAGMATFAEQVLNATNDAQRERVMVYADDWRRMKCERDELVAVLKSEHAQTCLAAPDCAPCALLARTRGDSLSGPPRQSSVPVRHRGF